MPITFAAADRVDTLRSRVVEFLTEQRASNPSFRVIDAGGGYNPWADGVTDSYVDLNRFDTDKELFVGDLCGPQVWEVIRASGRRWDFSICTQVLEDLRDPDYVIRNLTRISKAGYIATPTKHSELSNVESAFYLGYCHHRWIYTVRGADEARKLVAVAKFPVVGYLNCRWRPMLKLLHLLGRSTLLEKVERRLRIFPGGPGIEWVDRTLVGHDKELGLWWMEDLPFEYLRNDYAGDSCLETADLYRIQLRDGC